MRNKLFLIVFVTLLLYAASHFIGFLFPFRAVFSLYVDRIWWAVTLGLLLGGTIDHYVPREYISYLLARRKPRTVLLSVVLGFLMSACSHGILALSMQLYKKGASPPAVVSFLLASPWANFTITVMLFAFFGPKALFIVAGALLVALTTGFAFIYLERAGMIEKNPNTVDVARDFSLWQDITRRMKERTVTLRSIREDIFGIIKGTAALANMVLWWVILGALFASIIGAYVPTHIFTRYMGPTFLGLLMTLALATVIEVCSEGTSPLAFEIYRQTGAFGNSFIFLMAGVATDYTELGLVWTNIGKKTCLWLVALSVPQIVLLGWLANVLF